MARKRLSHNQRAAKGKRKRGKIAQVKQKLSEVDDELRGAVYTALEMIGPDAVEEIRRVIMTTPSALSRKPKYNRYDTGHMYDSAGFKVGVPAGRQSLYQLKLGWLEMDSRDRYIKIQEEGGYATWDTERTRFIEPMKSLESATTLALLEMEILDIPKQVMRKKFGS